MLNKQSVILHTKEIHQNKKNVVLNVNYAHRVEEIQKRCTNTFIFTI